MFHGECGSTEQDFYCDLNDPQAVLSIECGHWNLCPSNLFHTKDITFDI